jgi:hypothetical protein
MNGNEGPPGKADHNPGAGKPSDAVNTGVRIVDETLLLPDSARPPRPINLGKRSVVLPSYPTGASRRNEEVDIGAYRPLRPSELADPRDVVEAPTGELLVPVRGYGTTEGNGKRPVRMGRERTSKAVSQIKDIAKGPGSRRNKRLERQAEKHKPKP